MSEIPDEPITRNEKWLNRIARLFGSDEYDVPTEEPKSRNETWLAYIVELIAGKSGEVTSAENVLFDPGIDYSAGSVGNEILKLNNNRVTNTQIDNLFEEA